MYNLKLKMILIYLVFHIAYKYPFQNKKYAIKIMGSLRNAHLFIIKSWSFLLMRNWLITWRFPMLLSLSCSNWPSTELKLTCWLGWSPASWLVACCSGGQAASCSDVQVAGSLFIWRGSLFTLKRNYIIELFSVRKKILMYILGSDFFLIS